MNWVIRKRWYRLFHLCMVLLLMSGFLRPQVAHASTIVERWRGKVSVQGTYNATTGILLAAIPGVIHEKYTLDFDLQVDDTGFLNGDVYATLQSATFEQYGDRCGIILICKVSQTVGNPNAHVFVEGIRYLNAGQPEFSIDHMIKISPGSKIDTVSLSFGTQSDPEDWYPDLLSPGISPYVIQPYNLGRPPLAQVHSPRITSELIDLSFSGQLIGTGLEPLLDLDPELLEHSIFVAQVPIEDNFDANVDWNSSDAGWLTWQLGQQGAERVGPTKSKQVKKPVDVGFPTPGQTTLQVQAHNTIGKDSQPQNVQITVAPPVSAPDTRTSAVTGKKQGDFAAYKFAFKFPEPAFKLQVKNVGPIPFFDRGPFGIADTQATGEVEFKSTGEGSGKASIATAFEAMGSQAKGEVSVKTKAVLQADGLKFPEGEFGLKVSGKLKGEEPLIVLIPSLGAALNNILSKFPAARSVINKAKVVLEVEPKIGVVLTLLDQNGDIKFKNAQAQPGLAITGSLVLDLIKDILTATGSIGGDAILRLQVPAPYFQGGDLKLFAKAQLGLFRQAYNAEASYNGKFLPGGLAAVTSAAWSAVPNNNLVGAAATNVQGAWQPIDTAYLADPRYGHWNAPVTQRQEPTGPVDNQLIDVVSPLANPSLAVRNQVYGPGSLGSPQVAMVWAQDKQGAPQSDIKFTQGSVEYEVNDDNLDDFNPKVVFLPSNPDSNQLIVWQRFDSATPGDLNVNPNDYLSHLQIAAVHFNYNTSAREPVQLLSNDNTLNYRQQLVVTSDGALTVWINNQSNQILGDAAHPDRLLFARYTQANDNGSWSAAAPLLPSIAGLLDYKLAAANGHVALVYSQDTDGDMSTDTDRELFYMTFDNNAWSSPQRLTNDAVDDEAPQLALTGSGSPLVVWKRNDQLMFLSNAWTDAAVPLDLAEAALRNDFTLVGSIDGSAALTWQEVEPQNTQIGYAIYDALYSRWSSTQTVDLNPTAAPGTIHMANNIGAALAPADELLDGGRAKLFLGYQLTNMQLITRTIDGVDYPNIPEVGTQSLHLASVPLSTNLSVTPSDLTVSPSTAQPGDPLTIQAVIHNSGDLAIPADKVPVVLKATNKDQETTVLGTQLLPTLSAGTAITLNFATTRQALGDNLYSVEINPLSTDTFERVFREAVYTDNVATVGSALSASSLPTVYGTDGAIARIAVSQIGGLYSRVALTSTLRLNSPTGPQIAEIPINFPITPTTALESSSWVTASLLGPGSHQLYWAVDPNNTMGDSQLEDNLVATTVNVFPDLSTAPALIGWGHNPGNEAPISLRVENRGNWASAATHLTVWDQSPDQADSHVIGQIAIPVIEAGGYVELSGSLNLANTPAAATGLQAIYIKLDPDNTQEELSKNNNVVLMGGLLGGPYSEAPPSAGNALYLPLIRR